MPRVTEYSFLPGVLAVNTSAGFPADMPAFGEITSVVVTTGASGGTASTTSPANLTPTTTGKGAVPAGDLFYDPVDRSYQLGAAATTGTEITVKGRVRGSYSVTS